jgi:imidazole glycerol phosphate synthase glutamine amidotransferase subunit
MIGIIDYGMGNLGSVSNACAFLQMNARVISAPAEMEACCGVILPGVGGFGDCMRHLDEHGFVEPVSAWIGEDRPFLGICLGLQVLFAESEEAPGVPGLGVFPGRVRRFELGPEYKVPQIGWNRVGQVAPGCPLFRDIEDGRHFYFVHSYYVDTPEDGLPAGRTSYGIDYTSAVWKGNVAAVQFHPEKSQKEGLQMLRNFNRLTYAVGRSQP